MTRLLGVCWQPTYNHVPATNREDLHQVELQVLGEGPRRSWRLAAAVSVLLLSAVFTGAAVFSSKMQVSSQLKSHRTFVAHVQNAQDKNMVLPRLHLPDISGSPLGKLWKMLFQQSAAYTSTRIPSSSNIVPAVLPQQQLPAGSTSWAMSNVYGSTPGATVQNGLGTSQVGGVSDSSPILGQQTVEKATASTRGAPVPVLLRSDNPTVVKAPPTNVGSSSLDFLQTPPESAETQEPMSTNVGSSSLDFLQTPPVSPETQEPMSCSTVQDEVDYPGNDLGRPTPQASSEDCCEQCVLDQNCVAWTYVKVNQLCFLKGRHPRGALTAVLNLDTVSGMPSQVGRSFPVITHAAGQSLFCFSLMLPWGYEEGLLQFQYGRGQGIFGCDEYAVYSNQEIQVADGVVTKIVDSDLRCKVGGEFKTCLNTPVFLAVWKTIIVDNRPRFHDWTVKVDPDAVFFPARLSAVLVHHKETPQGIYLNNCKFGLHGPLEVFSRNAVATWGSGIDTCVAHFNNMCSGPCKWGEDMFIDQCMWKVLKVSRAFEPNLLVEEHCAPPAGWNSCSDPAVVAFHPFKNLETHRQCMTSAQAPLHMFK